MIRFSIRKPSSTIWIIEHRILLHRRIDPRSQITLSTYSMDWHNNTIWKGNKKEMQHRKLCPLQHTILVLLVLCTKNVAAIARPRSNANHISGITGGEVAVVSSDTAHTHDMAAGKQRIDFVKHTLVDRLRYVHSGKRTADFKTWLRKQGGDVTVKSFYGVEVDWEPLENPSEEKPNNDKSLQVFSKDNNSGPFSEDCLDLDLPANTLPSLYEGVPIHLLDNLEPSLAQLYWRTVQLSFKFFPVLSTTLFAVISSKFRRVWYKWVTASLGSSSAAFIKWGQWAATRSDMFPELLCRELEELQASAPKHAWSFSEKVMESTLGLPADALMDVFDSFDKEPLASGSVAQVYKAKLGGQLVAVKIRHPRVAQLIDMDFRIMTAFARICDYIPALSWLHIRESVEQFSHTMAAQAHLQVEGHHLEILNHNFQKWPTVNFPHPVYASSAVIIETFEPGVIVTDMLDEYDALASKKNGDQNSKAITVDEGEAIASDSPKYTAPDLIPVATAKFIVGSGLGLYLKMLLVDNLMHADLHPGNIMLAACEKGHCHEIGHDMDLLVVEDEPGSDKLGRQLKQTNLRICLVDAGMVAQLTEHESSTFIGLLASLGQGDGRLAAKFALRFSQENDLSLVEQEEFSREMVVLFQKICRGYGTNVDVGEVLRGILGLIRDHKVRIDANYATLVVNILCIQSLAMKVCPEYNNLDMAKPLLKNYFETFYEPDGTPKPRKAATAKFKRILPLKYLQKSLNDGAFFRRLKRARIVAKQESQ